MRNDARLAKLDKAAAAITAKADWTPLQMTAEESEHVFDILLDAGVDVAEAIRENAARRADLDTVPE